MPRSGQLWEREHPFSSRPAFYSCSHHLRELSHSCPWGWPFRTFPGRLSPQPQTFLWPNPVVVSTTPLGGIPLQEASGGGASPEGQMGHQFLCRLQSHLVR